MTASTVKVAPHRRRVRRVAVAVALLAVGWAAIDAFGSQPELQPDALAKSQSASVRQIRPGTTVLDVPRERPGVQFQVSFRNAEWYPVTVTGIGPPRGSTLRMDARYLPTGQADLSRAVPFKPVTVRPYGLVSYVVNVWEPTCPTSTTVADTSHFVEVNTRVFGVASKRVVLDTGDGDDASDHDQFNWSACT